MDVIPHAGSVVRIVIVAENRQMGQLADRHLSDVRHKVVRDTVRILTDPAAFVRADGVEVTESTTVQSWSDTQTSCRFPQ